MKTQTENQLKGRWGELVAAFGFPAHWVVRPLPHDYGVDLQVEVFEPIIPQTVPPKFRTTGGHLACQVKTSESLDTASGSITFPAMVSDLLLAESLGAAAPLLLLLVDRTTRLIYYLCLNDYVAKILDPSHESWREQETVSIRIPARNVLDVGDEPALTRHWQYLKGLAHRAKLYAAVSSFNFVAHELARAFEDWTLDTPYSPAHASEMREMASRYDTALRRALAAVDAPSLSDLRHAESPYAGMFDNLQTARDAIAADYPAAYGALCALDVSASSDEQFTEVQGRFELAAHKATMLIDHATVIGRVYEQTHREAGIWVKAIPYDVIR